MDSTIYNRAVNKQIDRLKNSCESKKTSMLELATTIIKKMKETGNKEGLFYVVNNSYIINRYDAELLGSMFESMFATSKFVFTIPDTYGRQYNESSHYKLSEEDYVKLMKME